MRALLLTRLPKKVRTYDAKLVEANAAGLKPHLFHKSFNSILIFTRGATMSACDTVSLCISGVLEGTSMLERMVLHSDSKHGTTYFV